MLINRNNYESFFLDYIEGRMNAEEQAGLMAFLAENPDLEIELGLFENIQISAKPEIFSEKQNLKRNISGFGEINVQNFNQYCIAKMENDLDHQSNLLFEKYLSNRPESLKEYKLFLKTFLEPDKNIVFADKQKLKHRIVQPHKNRFLIAVSVAASISLIVISYQFYNSYRKDNTKIYTAIHEKLKIDSLLTAKILDPVEIPEIKKEIIKSNYKKVANPYDTTKRYTTFKAQKPIEIVELQSRNQPEKEYIPIASISQFAPIEPLENKSSYLSVTEYASKELKKRLEIENMDIDKDLSLWKAAQTGVKQINKLTGLNISMNKEYDTLNNRTKVIIYTNLLSFYSSTKK